MNGYGSYGQPERKPTQKKPSAYGQQQYSPTGNSVYQPAIPQQPQQQQPRPSPGGSGDYSVYSPQRQGYSPQVIQKAVSQYNSGGQKGNWQSNLPQQGGGANYGNAMPAPAWQSNYGNPGGEVAKGRPASPPRDPMAYSGGPLRAYSDYQPQGGYQQDPRIIDPWQPSAPPSQPGLQPIDSDRGWMQPQPRQEYPRPTPWAFSQQQPQYSPPSAMPQSTFDAQYGQYGNGGGYASTPNTTQRDAFIQRLNDSMMGYQANSGVYQGQGAPPPSWGQAPQVNIPQMWSDAGSMVQSGWQNPLMGLM